MGARTLRRRRRLPAQPYCSEPRDGTIQLISSNNASWKKFIRREGVHGIAISQLPQKRVEDPTGNTHRPGVARAAHDRDNLFHAITRGFDGEPRVSEGRRKVGAKALECAVQARAEAA